MTCRALVSSPSLPSALLITRCRAPGTARRLVLRCAAGQTAEDVQSSERHFLQRGWLFSTPAVKVSFICLSRPSSNTLESGSDTRCPPKVERLQASISGQPESEVLVIRDDLLHPLVSLVR